MKQNNEKLKPLRGLRRDPNESRKKIPLCRRRYSIKYERQMFQVGTNLNVLSLGSLHHLNQLSHHQHAPNCLYLTQIRF